MIRYYLDDRMNSHALPGQKKYRVFAHIDDSNFWAVEWTESDSSRKTVITDLNAGFISELVREACAPLQEISTDEIRMRFASFGDYIVRCVGGFRRYMSWIAPSPEVSGIALQIPTPNLEARQNKKLS